MRADELAKRYDMAQHIENGSFVELGYPNGGESRAASGLIYYYVPPKERTGFHRIDCDEYWCHHAGAPLELWQISPDGEVSVSLLGVQEGCEPVIYLKAGVIFASVNRDGNDGAFLSCITVPRFSYDGFELFTDDDIQRRYPETETFFRD